MKTLYRVVHEQLFNVSSRSEVVFTSPGEADKLAKLLSRWMGNVKVEQIKAYEILGEYLNEKDGDE